MKSVHTVRVLHACLVAGIFLLTGMSTANATISQVPLFVKHAAPPVVMLTMSNDHQLFYKAYDDYSDVDGDKVPDTTYKHLKSDGSLNLYYGYFDPQKCYTYSTTNSRFQPAVNADATTNYCTAGSSYWSGNFLNWASMARIDTVRKMLYGGKRSTDSSTATVLERAFLPNDAHSWAKFYNGSDLNQLTPFTSATGITLCNTTVSTTTTGSGQYSQNVTANPLIRVAQGNYSLWAANERWQCRWSEEKSASNSNNSSASGIPAASSNPSKTSNGLGSKDYVARVQVCVSGLLGSENCLKYPTGTALKPIGLLQTYGESGNILFGLMTGSYGKNKSGGVLRKNAGSMANEINVDTDGTFKTPPTDGNIIGVLNALRLYGYTYDDGYYNDSSSGGDNCEWGWNSFNDGRCSNWGNPQAEIYLETLRYLAGDSADSNFNVDDTGRMAGLVRATWTDPMPTTNWCGRLNVINFNASTISYDADQLGNAGDVMLGAGSNPSLDDRMDEIATTEGISGNDFFVGENGTDNNQLCTSKLISDLADVRGTCPDAPRLSGSYYIAGLAYHAHAAAIRSFADQDGDGNPENKTVTTYGVALAPSVPVVTIPIPGVANKTVSILPACRNSDVGGNCAIVDFKIVSMDTAAGTGKIYVNWEDSEQGGDYDQDMWGTISWTATPSQITVTSDVIAESTVYDMGFGYVISGTTQDGFHAHSGIEGFSYTDPTGATGCNNCQVGNPASSVVYNLSGGTGATGLLEPPLWYAAKYGGFVEDEAAANNEPDLTSEWDSDGDGTPDNYYYATNPGQLEADLQTVFRNVSKTRSSAASVVANSVTLETNTFIYQAQFNSGEWSGDLLAYQVNSDGSVNTSASWNSASVITGQGSAGRTILTYSPTAADGVPFSWTVGGIETAQRDLLDINPQTTVDDNRGQERLNWLRGDQSEEVKNGGDLRSRTTLLGDIVNSTPYYVSKPAYFYPDSIIDLATYTNPASLYSTFKSTYDARTPMIYVGGNDGMLHGIRATDGHELLAYVPNTVFATLPYLTATNYQHQFYVNSSPTVGDAFFGNSGSSDARWHSVLVSGLGQGGKGIFALDVTDPSNFSEASAASIVLWEKNSTSTGYADLGYTLGQPAVAKMNNGKWAAIFSNGYGSTNGKAVLYIADVETGAVIKSIVLESAGANGLSTPAPADTDGDGDVDVIYAGDLKGNMWKVDVSDSNTSQWKTAFGNSTNPAPLFVATDASDNRQPITVRPEVIRNPQGTTGVMLFFGTGKYFEDGDESPSTRVQTMYGVIDDNVQVTGRTSSGDGDLQQQTILAEYADVAFVNPDDSTDISYFDVRETSGTPLPTAKKGWYLDLRWYGATAADKALGLGLDGEMQVTDPIVRNGVLIFTTLIPSSQPCEAGGDGWLMELDAASGSRLNNTPWDLNGDGRIDARDNYGFTTGSDGTPLSGKKSKVGIIQRPTIIEAGDIEYKYTSGSKQGQIEVTVEQSTARKAGRLSWEQVK